MEENILENNNPNTAVGHLRIAMLAYRGKTSCWRPRGICKGNEQGASRTGAFG